MEALCNCGAFPDCGEKRRAIRCFFTVWREAREELDDDLETWDMKYKELIEDRISIGFQNIDGSLHSDQLAKNGRRLKRLFEYLCNIQEILKPQLAAEDFLETDTRHFRKKIIECCGLSREYRGEVGNLLTRQV